MIVWSGLGFLGLLIPLFSAFIVTRLTRLMMNANYDTLHNWPMGLGLAIGGVLVFLLALRLTRPGRTLVDPATGQAVVVQRRDTIFFIPLRWAGLLWLVFGLLFMMVPVSPR